MLTQYNATHSKAIAGQPVGDWRESRPMALPWLPQITTVTTANGAVTDDWVITIVDDETGQTYSVTAAGSGTEATLDANMEAAFAAHAKLPSLFTLGVTSVSDVVATFTAKHANRTYTFSATGGTGANTIANSQEAGGSGIEFGLMVAQGTGDKEYRALTSTDTLEDLVGILFRTDGNHFHSLENDTTSAVDASQRGKTMAIMEKGRVWVTAQDAVAPGEPVFVRRAQTSSAGQVGGFLSAPAGGAQVATVTPTAAELDFMILIEYTPPGGTPQAVPLLSANPDGSATATEIADAWRTAAATAQADGVLAGFTFGGTSTLTITGPAGESFRVSDVGEGVSAVADTTPADVDALYVPFCRWESTASAGQLAELRINL